jgi:hypothetical protein
MSLCFTEFFAISLLKYKYICKIWNSHGDNYEEKCPLESENRLHSIFWGMMPDNRVSSGMWCLATQYHVACDVRLCSSTLQKTDFSTNILTRVTCCYLLKNGLLTGLHNIYLNIRQYPFKNWNWKQKIFQFKCCNIFLEVIAKYNSEIKHIELQFIH